MSTETPGKLEKPEVSLPSEVEVALEGPTSSPTSSLKNEFETAGLTVDAVTELYKKIAAEFSSEKPLAFSSFSKDDLRTEVVSRVFAVMASKGEFWKADNIAEFILDTKRKTALAEDFADKTLADLELQMKTSEVEQKVQSYQTLQKPYSYVATFGIDEKSGSVLVNVGLKDGVVELGAKGENKKYTPAQVAKFKEEFSSGMGVVVMYLFQMFGVIDMKKIAKLAGDDEAKSEALMNKELEKIINGKNLGGSFLCGILGYEFGAGTLETVRKMHPIGEKLVSKLENSELLSKIKVGDDGVVTETWDAFVFNSLSGAQALDKKLGLAKDLNVLAGKRLLVEIPAGKSVELKSPQSGSIKSVVDVAGNAVSYEKGPIVAGSQSITLVVEADSVIGVGSTFDEEVKLAWGEVEA